MTTQVSYSSNTPNSFWRSNAGTLKPDGTLDVSEDISRIGRTAIGNVQGNVPVAQLDVAAGARSGIDQRVAGDPFYNTGILGSVAEGFTRAVIDTSNYSKTLHSNQTQGVAVGFDGLTRIGSTANLPFVIRAKGTGGHSRIWESRNGNLNYDDNLSLIPPADNTGFIERWYENNVISGQRYLFTEQATPHTNRFQFDVRAKGTLVAGVRISGDNQAAAPAGQTVTHIGENRVHRRKLSLWGTGAVDEHDFYGFGILSDTLVAQVARTLDGFGVYARTGAGTSQQVFRANGDGSILIPLIPTAATNAAAPGPIGSVYKTATGELRIKY